jgi:thiol:disulfide interchange protein DsbG
MTAHPLMKRRHALVLLAAAGGALQGACSKTEPAASAGSAPAPQAGAAPAPVNAQEAYQTASRATGFTVGQTMAADAVIVFFDPQCPHCADLWTASQPVLGKLKMTWVPVGFLRQTSAPQGALILSAKNPAATMTEHEALLTSRQGGLPVPADVDANTVTKVKANTELLQKLGADSVPFILYKNRRTGTYGSHAGAVTTARLLEMVGA